MSSHRVAVRRRGSGLRSVRVRALLSLGVALGIGATGTFAFWTDDVVVSGTTFTAGTLDLQVDGADSLPAYTSLTMSSMVPGNSIAATLVVKNNGTAPLKYTASSSATNTPVGKDLAAALTVKVTGDTSTSGSGVAKTCAGSALAGTGTSLNGSIVSTGRQLAAGATETICVQVTLGAGASTTLQGGSTAATFTFSGTSDLS